MTGAVEVDAFDAAPAGGFGSTRGPFCPHPLSSRLKAQAPSDSIARPRTTTLDPRRNIREFYRP